MKILPTAFVKCWHLLYSKYGIPLLCTIHFWYQTNTRWYLPSNSLILWKNSRGTDDNSRNVTNPTALQKLVWTKQAYKFLKNTRGLPAYWHHEPYDVLAMLCSLGIPTWFLTLSAADLHWPEMIQAVALQLGRRLSKDDVLKMSIAQRSTYLRQNPITGVCMFQHRLQSFFSQYLLNDAHSLGHITDYVIKIEFQIRGSPHAHCLLWVKDAPKIRQDSDDDVCRFIDKYITAMMPKGVFERENDVNIMKSLQKHTHSDYWLQIVSFWVSKTSCMKNSNLMGTCWRRQSWWHHQVCKRCITKGTEFSIIYSNSKWEFSSCRFVTKSWDRPGHIHASFTYFTKRSQNNPAMKCMWHIHKCM